MLLIVVIISLVVENNVISESEATNQQSTCQKINFSHFSPWWYNTVYLLYTRKGSKYYRIYFSPPTDGSSPQRTVFPPSLLFLISMTYFFFLSGGIHKVSLDKRTTFLKHERTQRGGCVFFLSSVAMRWWVSEGRWCTLKKTYEMQEGHLGRANRLW